MRIVIIGGGGHASDVLGVIESLRLHADVGLAADGEIDLGRFSQRGVKQWGAVSEIHRMGATHYVVGIGYSRPRRDVQRRVASLAVSPITLIHPAAWVHPSATIGAGSVVLAGAVVSALASVGDHCVVHHNSVIGHDTVVEHFSTVLPGAVVSGDAHLEEACVIGSRAVVIEKLRIGREAFVGAGAVVTRDVPPQKTALGVPAKFK